ncbi:MAG: DUF494 family protein [bacterium]
MNERVVEILILIMSEIKRNRDRAKNLELLSKDLMQRGYTENEISSAFSWLLNRLDGESEELIQNQGPTSDQSFRLLHEIERSIISTEAYGYVIQLKELGIIDEMDVEQVLEKAMMMGTSQVSVADIKSIVASILFINENFRDGMYFLFEENPVIH